MFIFHQSAVSCFLKDSGFMDAINQVVEAPR